MQFAELLLFDRRSGQDADCAFIRYEIDAVIPGGREIGIPKKFGQDRSLRRRIGQGYRRQPEERVENHHGMFGLRQPSELAPPISATLGLRACALGGVR